MPELDAFVRERTLHYDPAYLSSDPAFVHAHITALGPFLPPAAINRSASLAINKITCATEPFDFALEHLDTFPNGIIHLVPDPDGPFRALTEALCRAFPTCPPYAGQFADVRPHLTLDALSPEVSEVSTRHALAGLLPAACRATHLDLAWWAPGECRVLGRWPLGGASAPRGASAIG